jgi:hypothetical protein
LEAAGVRGQGAAFRLTVPRRAGIVLTRSPIDLPFADGADATDAVAPGVIRAGERG